MNAEDKIRFLQSVIEGKELKIQELKDEVARREPIVKQMDTVCSDQAASLTACLDRCEKQDRIIHKLAMRCSVLQRRALMAQDELNEFSDERQRSILWEMKRRI